MKKSSLWLVSVTIAIITFLTSFFVSSARNSTLASEASSIFAHRTQVYLNQITSSLHDDLLMEHIRLVRGRLSSLREEALFSEYSIQKGNQLLEESNEFATLKANSDFLLSVIPVYFSPGGERWGSISYLTSYHDLNQILWSLQANVVIHSLAASAVSLLGVVLFFAFVWRSGTGISRYFEGLLAFGREEEPSNLTKLLWAPMLGGIKHIAIEFRRVEKELEQSKIQSALSSMAVQVSHDIRSPLSALNMITGTLQGLPEEKWLIIRNATQRINDIANQLLQKGRPTKEQQSTTQALAATESVMLVSLLDSIVSEKRVQFRERMEIEVQGDLSQGYGLFAHICAPEFARVISNLVNNSIEALIGPGLVTISIRGYAESVAVIISDNGKGIPPDILARLGERGVTHGKEGTQSGSGLGVFHAREAIKKAGGKFGIQSQVGVGTMITISLPRVATPSWFVDKIILQPGMAFVSADDDQTIHQICAGRLASSGAVESGNKHLTFSSLEQFEAWVATSRSDNKTSVALYFVGYEFLGQAGNGLDIIERTSIGPHAILVTSLYEEPHVRARAASLNVKILPKALVPFVTFEIKKS